MPPNPAINHHKENCRNGERIARRRAALGNPDLPRNAGTRRTQSERALLKAIEAAGGKW